MDCSPPGTSVLPSPPPRDLPNPRITLVSLRKKEKEVSCCHVQLFGIPWTVTCQAPLFMGFPRQDHWSGLPFLSPGDLPHQEIEPGFLALQMDSLPSKRPRKSRPLEYWFSVINLNMTPRKSHCSCVERACFNFPE